MYQLIFYNITLQPPHLCDFQSPEIRVPKNIAAFGTLIHIVESPQNGVARMAGDNSASVYLKFR